MKLIVQIPCLNEEKTLPAVINSIPKHIKGVDEIEILIIDDGSTDKTAYVAKHMGVHHIVKHTRNKGLALSFADGVHRALAEGADIIVNTDADNQYPQKDIPKLIAPILQEKAEIVIADRQTDTIKHFSPLKKLLQKLGSTMVRRLSGTEVPDAVSGFRAYSRNAAIELNIVTDFSYVIETIIQAQYKRMAVASVPVKTNAPTRKSRLFKNMFEHIRHSSATLIRIYAMYRPLAFFVLVGTVTTLLGSLFAIRFFYYFIIGEGAGHIQSLIFAAIFIMVGFQIFMTGLVADLIGINRKLEESVLNRIKRMDLMQRKTSKISTTSLEYIKKIQQNELNLRRLN
ncbi:MAG: glycosyltransferase [Candidatus Levyibacteriota bacterium]